MTIDYDRISENYDRHRRSGGPFVAPLGQLAQSCHARHVLEVGPGTGNVTASFLDAYPCSLIGLEPSAGMLAKAAAKNLPVAWIRGAAQAIPLTTGSMDYVFACYVLHHIPDLLVAMRECARVLRPGGCAAFVTTSHEYIRRHPMNHYFPSFAAVDTARFQPAETVVRALEQAGFARVEAHDVVSPPYVIDRAYADRVANRFISTYDLIPEDEFREGVRRLYADLEPTGRLGMESSWEALMIWGYKPAP